MKYVDKSKASVLTIDPSGESSLVPSKWCVASVLPPAEVSAKQSGRLFLCDLGFTKAIFAAVGIKYQSPFGAKFLIPLHSS